MPHITLGEHAAAHPHPVTGPRTYALVLPALLVLTASP